MRKRQRIMTNLSQWDVSNLITFSEDMHYYLAGYQQTTYSDPLRNSSAMKRQETESVSNS